MEQEKPQKQQETLGSPAQLQQTHSILTLKNLFLLFPNHIGSRLMLSKKDNRKDFSTKSQRQLESVARTDNPSITSADADVID
jgi:hypothetical protein